MDKALKKRWQRKEQGIKNVSQNYAHVKRRVHLDLHCADEVTRLTALAVALILETSERVGNANSAHNGHFGITTLQKQHIRITGDKIALNYIGKSGVVQSKTVLSPILAKFLTALLKRRSPSVTQSVMAGNALIFETSTGVKITRHHVNQYLEPFGIVSKDIRTYNANETLKAELSKKQTAKEAVEKTAATIGNKPTTLKTHYILPKTVKKLK